MSTMTITSEPPVLIDLTVGGDLVLVEDEPFDAQLIAQYLKRSAPAWRLHHAPTLAQGLKLVDACDPDLALVDLNLPDATGLATVRSFRTHHPDLPLIVESSVDDTDTTTEALRLGAQDYLIKDEITADALERSIRYALARHRAQQQLAAADQAIRVRDEDLSDFAHVIAHDLRGPIRTSRLLANRLLDRLDTTDDITLDLGARLEESLGRVDGMILSMLEYAALGHDRPRPQEVSLHWVVSEARAALEADLDEVEASLVMPIDPLVQAWGRVDLLERVVGNLLSNAIKYRVAGRRPILRFELQREVDEVVLSLVDNGMGVPPGERERVFLPLERAHPNVGPGLGFGLAICRRIVESLDGEIWIEGNDLGGTTVRIRLRRAPDLGHIDLR